MYCLKEPVLETVANFLIFFTFLFSLSSKVDCATKLIVSPVVVKGYLPLNIRFFLFIIVVAGLVTPSDNNDASPEVGTFFYLPEAVTVCEIKAYEGWELSRIFGYFGFIELVFDVPELLLYDKFLGSCYFYTTTIVAEFNRLYTPRFKGYFWRLIALDPSFFNLS